jgi:hypothetical protein
MVKPINPTWKGETVYILGGGPSLASVDLDQLRDERVIVINRSFRLALWADILYFSDRGWWLRDGAEAERRFMGELVTISDIDHPRVRRLHNTGLTGLERDTTGLRNGTNSGYAAINLAYHLGAARIVLLGYDMRTVDGRTHAHGGYGVEAAVVSHVLSSRMLPYFDGLVDPLARAGVEVLNATEGSELKCWPIVELAEVKKTPRSSRELLRALMTARGGGGL